MNGLAITPAEWAIVREILQRLVPPGVRVFAFGSRARGTDRRWSDLDLALESDRPIPLGLLDDLAEAFDESLLGWKVDLLDRSAVSEAFGRIIEQEKIELDLTHPDAP